MIAAEVVGGILPYIGLIAGIALTFGAVEIVRTERKRRKWAKKLKSERR